MTSLRWILLWSLLFIGLVLLVTAGRLFWWVRE